MKYLKVILFLLISAMIISITSCNKDKEEVTPDITNPDNSGNNDDGGTGNDDDGGTGNDDDGGTGNDDDGGTGNDDDGGTGNDDDGGTGDDDDGGTGDDDDGGTGDDPLRIYRKIYGASDIYLEGNFVVIKTNGTPDHKSPYYTDPAKHENYNGTNSAWKQNPNTISSFNFTFKIPLNPVKATNHAATPLGTMGISLNGVAFYNQYAGPNNQVLTSEINSFDQYNGHPTATSVYHYHVEPLYLTSTKGKDVLLGFLLDGFPVYGVIENGATVQNSVLDEFHGHTHATADYPNGIYHYHITDAAPYINGNGFYGTPGTVTR